MKIRTMIEFTGGGATGKQAPSSVLAESNGIKHHPEPKAKDPIKMQVDSSSSHKTILNCFVRQSAPNDRKKSKHAAFTMAEVLITLGIIGIVAAMTLPGVIEGYQKAETVNRLKKAYSVMAQAIELSEVHNESVKYWNFNQSNADFFNQYLKPHFAKINETTYGKISDQIKYTRPNGSVENNFTLFWSDSLIINTVDGMTFFFPESLPTNKHFAVDINGYKKPNRFGRDLFVFVISQEYGFVPYGYKYTCDMNNGYDTFDREQIKSAWR